LSAAGSSRPVPPPFDFTDHAQRLCEDICRRVEQLQHVDMSRVAISFAQVRSRSRYGLQASLTPLRFENGALSGIRQGRRYRMQRLFDARGRELLYILTFYLPRFLNHPLPEKIETVIHELWHISPRCDGDLRRFAGRCYAHGASQKDYDAVVARLARQWWSLAPPAEVYGFLEHDFSQLQRRFGRVMGMRVAQPKLLPEEP